MLLFIIIIVVIVIVLLLVFGIVVGVSSRSRISAGRSGDALVIG
jgi:flagellar basal body-associated protein FliL